MTLSALGIFSAAGAGGLVSTGTYELIETQILTTTASSITFSSLATFASTYRHLQIRVVGRCDAAANEVGTRLRFNGVSGTSYSTHGLNGTGSGVGAFSGTSTSGLFSGVITGSTSTANSFYGSVIDILDAYSSTKNKTVRTLYGGTGAAFQVGIHSGAFLNTNSATSITLLPDSGSFVSASRFSLYGVK